MPRGSSAHSQLCRRGQQSHRETAREETKDSGFWGTAQRVPLDPTTAGRPFTLEGNDDSSREGAELSERAAWGDLLLAVMESQEGWRWLLREAGGWESTGRRRACE